jgi:hypothetical protein
MIAVLASRLDSEAASLIREWRSAGAALLSAEDLTRPGWIFDPLRTNEGSVVVSGTRVDVSDIRAVLTRRPAVFKEELSQIDPADRQYVASETNAFLVAWLSALHCKVVNRPTTRSLCGPAWDSLHWRCASARVGARWAAPTDETAPDEVVVCAEECLFARTAEQARIATALAREAGVELLGVWFMENTVSRVTVAPSLANSEVRARLLSHLVGVP